MPLGDFEIGKTLGKGAFGMVCLVKRKIDGEAYAMKRVKIAQLSAKEKENALNEIRILASLSHPNIIGYKEAFFDEDSKTLNIVMEFADDGDISKKIKYNLKNGLLFRENIIWNYLIQILEGLNYLHEKKIIHRDLKSANIFITKNGIIKIGDLNVSKINKLGMAYTQTGTPYYASPEIWIDKPYDYKCDIWSLGCILYELCKLKPPFRGTSLKNLCKNIQEGVYEPIPQIYSNELKSVIGMLLKTNPDQRPSTNLILGCDIIVKKIKELNLQNPLGMSINEGKQGLIATIKMPRNMREINRSLPMKRYNNKQGREEMLKEDEFETNKKQNGFLDQQDKIDMQQMFGNIENSNSGINNNYINNDKDNFNNNYNNMNNNLNSNNYNDNFISNNYNNNININYNNINNINYNNNYDDLNRNLMVNKNIVNYNNNYIPDNNKNFNNIIYQNNNNNNIYNMYKNNNNENMNYNIAHSQNYKNYEIKKKQILNQQQYPNIQNNQFQSVQNPHILNNNHMKNNNNSYNNNIINASNINTNNPWDLSNNSNEYSNNYSNNNKKTPKFKVLNNEEDINKNNKRSIHSNKSYKKNNNNNKLINNSKIPQTKNRSSNICKPKTPNRVYCNQRNVDNKNKIERKSNTRPTTANNNINMRNNNHINNKNNKRRNNNIDNNNKNERPKSKQGFNHHNNYVNNNMMRNSNNNNIANFRINNYEGNMEYYEELNKNCNYKNINIINNAANKPNRKRALSTANPRRVHVNYNNNNIQQKNNINIVNEHPYTHNNYNNINVNKNKNINRPVTDSSKKTKDSCSNVNKPFQNPKRSNKVIIEKYNYQPKKLNRNNSCSYNNNNSSNSIIKRKASMNKNRNVISKNKRGYEDNNMKKVINNNNVYNYRNYVKNAN